MNQIWVPGFHFPLPGETVIKKYLSSAYPPHTLSATSQNNYGKRIYQLFLFSPKDKKYNASECTVKRSDHLTPLKTFSTVQTHRWVYPQFVNGNKFRANISWRFKNTKLNKIKTKEKTLNSALDSICLHRLPYGAGLVQMQLSKSACIWETWVLDLWCA